MNLQDSHGVQGRGCLARSTISCGHESGRQLTGFGQETRTFPPSGGISWAQVHRDRSLHLGNARIPPGSPAIEGSEDRGKRTSGIWPWKGPSTTSSSCTSGKKGTGAEHGCEPHLTPRNQSSSREGSGLGGLLTSSPILKAARASMAISSGSGAAVATTPEPRRTFILRGRKPIPRCCDRHPILGWCTEWNAGCPVGRTSKITRQPDRTFAAWGVRSQWGCTWRRGSYWLLRSFKKGKARSQRSHAHTHTTGARVRHPQTGNDRNQKDTDGTASWKRHDHPWFALLEFALLVEVPREIAAERDSADCNVTPTRNKTKMNGFVEISTLFIHPFIPVCTGSGSDMQNPLI